MEKRASLKSVSRPNWREKLREECFKRVRKDRSRLLWKMRMPTSAAQSNDHKDFIRSAFRGVVLDELKKINDSSSSNKLEISPSTPEVDDILWKYNGLHDTYQGNCEERLLEMQRIFYEDLQAQSVSINLKSQDATWEDEEDEYLAHALYEHMQPNVPIVNRQCGSGPCNIIVSKTEKHPGWKFYACPNTSDPTCKFFMWFHDVKAPMCPCNAGACSVNTMKDGPHAKRLYYACRVPKGHGARPFFEWVLR